MPKIGRVLACTAIVAMLSANAQDRPRLKLDYLEQGAEPDAIPAEGDAEDPAAIEAQTGGRLGIALVDREGKLLLGFNRDERFAMCSTFKAPLAAAIVSGAAGGRFGLEGTLPLREKDVLDYAPVVKANLAKGRLSIGELTAAAVEVSDNSAANIVYPLVGGPKGLTRFVRDHGDMVTRFDRTEPDLNENAPDDKRDTTSPAAMAGLMARLMFQDMPGKAARTLRGWLEASSTGKGRIRAGLPQGWSAGDKTGSCGTAYNDVAVLRAPSGNDYVLAIYLDRPTVEGAQAEAAIARATRATLAMMNIVARNQQAPSGEDRGDAPVRQRAGPPVQPVGR